MSQPTIPTDDELKNIVEDLAERGLGAPGSVVSDDRLRNMRAFLAEPEEEWAPPEIEDRSDFVATDVADSVEWMLPSLLRVFAGSRKAIEAVAKRPQFEESSSKVSEVLRHHFWVESSGLTFLYDWLKSGLISKTGFARVGYESEEVAIDERYRGMTSPQLAMLLKDDAVEVVEAQERQTMVSDGISEPVPLTVYDVLLRKKSPEGKCTLVNVPPDEMRLASSALHNDRCPRRIGQVSYRTRDWLASEGYDVEEVAGGDDDGGYSSSERNVRMGIDSADRHDDDDRGGDLIRFIDAYLYLRDGDKMTWRRVVMTGDTLQKLKPEDEEVDDHPFVWWSPSPMPGAFFGHCPADWAYRPQRLRTNLIRAIEDNVYLQVNGRTEVPEDAIGKDTIADLLDGRPQGIVRTKKPGMLQPLVQPNLSDGAWNMVEWGEQWLEKRTGFSRMSKGLSPDTLNTETATGVLELVDRADMRNELIARMAADGLEWVLTKMLKCLSQYQDVGQWVRINGTWVDYDPREWANQYTLRVDVGMGAGNKSKRAASLLQLNNIQALMIGAKRLPFEAAIALARDLAGALGEDSPEKYFPDPLPEQPPAPDPKIEAEKMREAGEVAKAQWQSQEDEKQRAHELRMKQMELASKERETLVTLAAGILSARTQAAGQQPGPNLINGTNLDQTAQSADLSAATLAQTAAAIQTLASGVMPGGPVQ